MSFDPGASLWLGGQQVASSWAGDDDLAALDDVEFNWGRAGIWDHEEAGVLTCKMIDRTGRYAAGTSLDGLSLLFKWHGSSTPVTRFNGRVTGWASERKIVKNPRTAVREAVWVVSITAASRLAGLAKTTLLGPSVEYTGLMPAGDPELATGGAGGYPWQYPGNRIQALLDAGARSMVGSIQYPPASPTGAQPMQAPLRAEELPNALDMIRNCYATQIGRVGFNPDLVEAGSIRFIPYLTASPMTLVRSAGQVILQALNVTTIPANRVGVPQGIAAEATVADGVDWYDFRGYVAGFKSQGDQSAGTVKKPQPVMATVPGQTPERGNTLPGDYGMLFFRPPYTSSGAYPWTALVNDGWREHILRQTALFNAMRNKLKMPTLRYDTRRLPLADEALTELAHRPLATSQPVYYPGSVFNPLANAGPQYQVIGGRVRYQGGGWVHDVRVIPVQSTVNEPLTLQQLFGSSSATLAQWSPDIHLGDLVNVTQGLTS